MKNNPGFVSTAKKLIGPITEEKLVYCSAFVALVSIVSLNGLEGCVASATGQFVMATNTMPVAFKSDTLTAALPADSSVIATSFNPDQVDTSSICKINLADYKQVGEQTTNSNKTFSLYTLKKDRIVIVPKDNPETGNIVLTTKPGFLNVKACGVTQQQGLTIGEGKNAVTLNLSETDEVGNPMIFKVKVNKSEKTVLTVL